MNNLTKIFLVVVIALSGICMSTPASAQYYNFYDAGLYDYGYGGYGYGYGNPYYGGYGNPYYGGYSYPYSYGWYGWGW